ncbi:hypothetical protein PMAYCL1PPCAC_08889, partial [Pristionchus mayeri]
ESMEILHALISSNEISENGTNLPTKARKQIARLSRREYTADTHSNVHRWIKRWDGHVSANVRETLSLLWSLTYEQFLTVTAKAVLF